MQTFDRAFEDGDLELKLRFALRPHHASSDALAPRIIEFIKTYNREATPFRWTYDSRPLKIA